MVEDLKTSQPVWWYSKLKRMSSNDRTRSEEPTVQSFLGLPDQTHAEKIANQFSEISYLYQPIKAEDIYMKNIENMKPSPV